MTGEYACSESVPPAVPRRRAHDIKTPMEAESHVPAAFCFPLTRSDSTAVIPELRASEVLEASEGLEPPVDRLFGSWSDKPTCRSRRADQNSNSIIFMARSQSHSSPLSSLSFVRDAARTLDSWGCPLSSHNQDFGFTAGYTVAMGTGGGQAHGVWRERHCHSGMGAGAWLGAPRGRRAQGCAEGA